MLEDIIEMIKAIIPYCFVVLCFIFIFSLIRGFISTISGTEKRNIEWHNKVNACVLDMNSRKDCKLIIYKDRQIHNQHNDNSDMATGMAIGTATGMAVGMGMR